MQAETGKYEALGEFPQGLVHIQIFGILFFGLAHPCIQAKQGFRQAYAVCLKPVFESESLARTACAESILKVL